MNRSADNETFISTSACGEADPDKFLIHYRIINSLLIAAIIVIGSFGNAIVLLGVICVRELRNFKNLPVANLALADFLISAGLCPLMLADLHVRPCVYTQSACLVEAIVALTSLFASVFCLTFMAFNRYIAVCRSPSYTRIFTGTKTRVMMASVWVYALALVMAPFAATQGDALHVYVYSSVFLGCTVSRLERVPTLLLSVNLLLPLAVATVCYIRVIAKWRERMRVSNSLAQADTDDEETGRRQRVGRTEVMLLVAFACFMFGWTPFVVLTFAATEPRTMGNLDTFVLLVALMNSGANPIIYGLLNTNFKRAYWRVLSALLGKLPCVGR